MHDVIERPDGTGQKRVRRDKSAILKPALFLPLSPEIYKVSGITNISPVKRFKQYKIPYIRMYVIWLVQNVLFFFPFGFSRQAILKSWQHL